MRITSAFSATSCSRARVPVAGVMTYWVTLLDVWVRPRACLALLRVWQVCHHASCATAVPRSSDLPFLVRPLEEELEAIV